MGMGVSVVAHQWEEVVLHDRDNERADQLTDSHAPDLGLQGKLTNHLVIERQASSSFLTFVFQSNGKDGRCLIVYLSLVCGWTLHFNLPFCNRLSP